MMINNVDEVFKSAQIAHKNCQYEKAIALYKTALANGKEEVRPLLLKCIQEENNANIHNIFENTPITPRREMSEEEAEYYAQCREEEFYRENPYEYYADKYDLEINSQEDYEDAMDLDADICQYMSDAYLGGYSHC
ncbi:MAG: hypothetical protein SPJ89_09255 [Treponema sp.]|nr:hypothetical protein [Spirochaetia bacterium]MDD7459799.1 hypothetical protein [Spirochaetales bacterium]MDY5812153.1 hypothetical protein [Treponema sp.]